VIFTGQTASCNGGPSATKSVSVDIPPTEVVGFTAPSQPTPAGRSVALDAFVKVTGIPGSQIRSFGWTVNGRELAVCAGSTSQLRTSTLPVGDDIIDLTATDVAGQLTSVKHEVVVSVAGPKPPVGARVVALPMVATCITGPGDPSNAQVAPTTRGGLPEPAVRPRWSRGSSRRWAA
jgi:hypothetical protein